MVNTEGVLRLFLNDIRVSLFIRSEGFQQTGKQDNAGRFESGYLKVTTENLISWTLP